MTCDSVLFDLDGTLVDSEPLHEYAFHRTLEQFGLKLPAGFHDEFLGVSGDLVHAAILEACDADIGFEAWENAKFRHFSSRPEDVRIRSHVGALPERLHARNVRLAVVSNSSRDEVSFLLGASGLDRFFEHVVTREDVQNGKPAPDSYLLACERLGRGPGRCLVVEDSFVGATAGLNAKMHVIFHPQVEAETPIAGAQYLSPAKDLWPVLLESLVMDSNGTL